MAAVPQSGQSALTPSIALTKFRAQRLRADTVARPALLARLVAAVSSHPVTLVSAPGGSGKSTLLAQFANAFTPEDAALLWISIDADDDFPERFFAALLGAVEPLGLSFDHDPRELIAGVGGEGPTRRLALAALVNALCTSSLRRIVLVLDDLHRLACPDVYRMLESLIERLPEHVAVVIGSRVEPTLPLARWRAHAELAELTLADLKFGAAEAARLAEFRTGAVPDAAAIRTVVDDAHGWAVGVSMLLQAVGNACTGEDTHSIAAAQAGSRRHLFAYLAQEILAELEPELQAFALECSILEELHPQACASLTDRKDAAALLERLYRRNLFLTAIDETVPVLRFHDLFRTFLERELERRDPVRMQELHERAARSSTSNPRAIHHWLKAGRWQHAIDAIVADGEPRLVAGGIAMVENWIQRVPEGERSRDPRIGLLHGACAWQRWDWATARRELERSVDAIASDPAALSSHVRSLIQLIDVLNSSGAHTAARQRLAQAEALSLDDEGRAEVALLRAWCLAREGDYESVADSMREFVDFAALDPVRICPSTAGRIHCMLIGLPGIAATFERFGALSESVACPTPAPWNLAALAVRGWSAFWRGDRVAAEDSLARAEATYQQFGSIRLVGERIGQLKAIYLAATGDTPRAVALANRHIEGLASPEVDRHRQSWLRAYRHAFNRMHWMAGDEDAFCAQLPYLLAPRAAAEWPFLDTAALVARGQAATFKGRWQDAAALLEAAVESQRRWRMPMVFADPRVSLAWVYLMQGNRQGAAQTFLPAYLEAVEQNSLGHLILDARDKVRALLVDALPAQVARSAAAGELRARLDQWSEPAAGTGVTVRTAGPLDVLTERELEVLASVATGAGNKHIARSLTLSLHTVKRHIANILDKLDCDSRGQAADVYRRFAK
jgi:LuxR family maltose regulon positive regulatory protein